MRIGLLTVAIAALSGASCARTQSPSALHDAPFEQISLQRTECLGSCPSYTVTLYGDGTVIYSGRAYVASTGEHRSTIPRSSVSFLLSAFDRASFLSLREAYQSEQDGCKEVSTDNPSLIIRYKSKSIDKSVMYDMGCRGPKEMSRISGLADTIDGITLTAQWVGRQ